MTDEQTIVDRIADYLETYMVFPGDHGAMPGLEPGDQATAIALWVLHTRTFADNFPRKPWTTPYLFVNSKTPRSGKTLLIDLLEPITHNPERTIDMTASVMFKLIEEVQPTLFIDEIDALSGPRREAARGTLNGGYKHSGYVWRSVGQETRKYRTFCPKLLAGIAKPGLLDETVESRCLYINLERVGSLNDDGELVDPSGGVHPIFYAFMAEPEAEQLNREIQAFVSDWAAHYTDQIPKPIPGISPRSWEIAMPLIQVARACGIEDYAREVLKRMFAPPVEREDKETQVLRAIQAAFNEEGQTALFVETLMRYVTRETGEGWNGKSLGGTLAKLGIGKSTVMTIQNQTKRGYYAHQFKDAWEDRRIGWESA